MQTVTLCDMDVGETFVFTYNLNEVNVLLAIVTNAKNEILSCTTRRFAFKMQDQWHHTPHAQEENANYMAEVIPVEVSAVVVLEKKGSVPVEKTSGEVPLKAATAHQARREIKERFPQGANYRGYDKDGEVVIMSLVRRLGDKAGVATVKRNRANKPVRFTCTPLFGGARQ